MHHVKSHITRTYRAYERVHVGSVIIEQTACGMYQIGNLADILLKESQGIGVGHHYAGNGIVQQRFQVLYIDQTVGI